MLDYFGGDIWILPVLHPTLLCSGSSAAFTPQRSHTLTISNNMASSIPGNERYDGLRVPPSRAVTMSDAGVCRRPTLSLSSWSAWTHVSCLTTAFRPGRRRNERSSLHEFNHWTLPCLDRGILHLIFLSLSSHQRKNWLLRRFVGSRPMNNPHDMRTYCSANKT